MKVLITGAGGFVGKAIVGQLSESENDEVEIFQIQGRRRQKENDLKDNNRHNFSVDITDLSAVLGLEKIGAIYAVVHAAGLAHQFNGAHKERFRSVNVKGTENILELSRRLGVKHIILLSSVSVYGNSNNPNHRIAKFHEKIKEIEKVEETKKSGKTENSECSPIDAYSESKLEGEIIARRICEEAGINLTILRLATVIGEEDRGNFLRLIKAIDKRRFFWIGKGINYKSLIHREDVASAVVKILKEKKEGIEIFNVAAEPLQMRQIVETVSQTLNKNVVRLSVSQKLFNLLFFLNSKSIKNRKIENMRRTVAKWLADDVYSSEKLRREYGYEPKIRVREAIIREVKWYLRK